MFSILQQDTHSCINLSSTDANPVVDTFAIQGIKAMMAALPILVSSDDEEQRREAQEKALYAAWLCGTCLGSVGMALHHKLCHTLGGTLDTPHAQTHTVILPYALQYNYASVSALAQNNLRLAFEVEGDDKDGTALARKIYDVSEHADGPTSLQGLGVKEGDLDMIVHKVLATPYPNPAPLEETGLRRLLQRAWKGERPIAQL
jgi:maleylacetate reductase